MTRTVDPLIAALAAGTAALTCYGCLSAAIWISPARPGFTLRLLVGNSAVLGLGLWSACALEALALSPSTWPEPGFTGWLLPLALAGAGQLCGLLFVATRDPDLPAIAGSAFSFAAALAETQWWTLQAGGGLLDSGSARVWAGAFLLLAFAGFAVALRMALDRRRFAPRIGTAARAVFALVPTIAILGLGASVPWESQLPLVLCCAETLPSARLLAVTIAAVAAAALIVRQLSAIFQHKLEEHASRSRHDLAEVHARLHHIATHDPLTGLPNRNILKERLATSLAGRHHPGRTIAVAALDLDRFSSINHSLGHAVGDGVLIEIAHRLEAAVPAPHTLARVGGDSFALLIDSVSARMEAHAVTSAMLAALEQPFLIHGEEIRVRLSIGVSVSPDDARRGDDLLAHAEAALVNSKRQGGGRVFFFDPSMSDSMQERLALENDLRRALAAREFEIHYQPQISTRTGRVLSVEALLRWRHPQKGLIAPSSFIPLAEQTGLIVPMDGWVLRETCRQARVWLAESGLNFKVAVNLSAMQFRGPDALDTIVSAVNSAGLDPRVLEIELTESALMVDPEKSASTLKLLRAMGVSIAIDDFGTGYSSLSYLRRLPIDKLKIDRSFVRDLPTSPTDESIVRAIVSLAHSVGLQVVAEGVETAEQLERIRALDCDQWQGYYCCPPQPAAELAERLAEDAAISSTGLRAALTRATRLLGP
ncbi:MAG TPA: bifunctional diguanylate cyclase/phosphodiesterase [Steroidobacteraceae bacterium]|nr:bifunctional diguanylate cyclase/phosphodiesterase [Steroidobacteraceae bacterium]